MIPFCQDLRNTLDKDRERITDLMAHIEELQNSSRNSESNQILKTSRSSSSVMLDIEVLYLFQNILYGSIVIFKHLRFSLNF